MAARVRGIGVWRWAARHAPWRAAAGLVMACAVFATTGGHPARAAPLPLGLLSIERIFAETRPDFTRLTRARLHTLLVTGDVGLVRMVNYTNLQTNDFRRPFLHTADLLRSADITWINLEGPLTPGCAPTQVGLVFCGDPRNVGGLQFAGVDVAGLANNHILDQGRQGLESSRQILQQAGIAHTGNGRRAVLTLGDVRFGFLAYDAVIGPVDRAAIAADIDRLRDEADVVAVQYHWGAEYVRTPAPFPGHPTAPRDLARFTINAGADLVIGNHPHWFQGVELYRGKLIAYAHGNFAFDQPWSDETERGVVGLYTFYDDRLIDVRYIPIRMREWGQPRLAEGAERAYILTEMRRASEALKPY